ncbi:CRISPR-associated protein Csx3 [Patescibacteria group bacterium]|nr:CRISPR-associated protein Csx3 [Patescibacteria group bacterium]
MPVSESAYKVELKGDILFVGFGKPAQNDQIVKDAVFVLDQMAKSGEMKGGKLIKINGPASLPVALAIGHAVSHLYGAVAVFDPKMNKYVISVSHNPEHRPGDLVE